MYIIHRRVLVLILILIYLVVKTQIDLGLSNKIKCEFENMDHICYFRTWYYLSYAIEGGNSEKYRTNIPYGTDRSYSI